MERSDTTPIKICPQFFQNVTIMRNFFDEGWHYSVLLSRPHEIVTFGPTPHFIALTRDQHDLKYHASHLGKKLFN